MQKGKSKEEKLYEKYKKEKKKRLMIIIDCNSDKEMVVVCLLFKKAFPDIEPFRNISMLSFELDYNDKNLDMLEKIKKDPFISRQKVKIYVLDPLF